LNDQTAICHGPDGDGGHQKVFDDTKGECDHTQSSLETTACAHVTEVKETCETFSVCTNTLLDSYENQKPGIDDMEAQRKHEWHATDRLLCILDVFGTDGSVDQTKLQTCQGTVENTSHLTLTHPTPNPRPSPCADYLPHPCRNDYISAEYGALDSPAATCTPCVLPGSPPVPGNTVVQADFESRPQASSCERYTDTLPGSNLGAGPHTVVMALRIDAGNTPARQWIMNIGQTGIGAEHWIYNKHTGMDNIQFGAWATNAGNQLTKGSISRANTLATTYNDVTKEYKLYIDGTQAATKQNVVFNIQSPDMKLGTFVDGSEFVGCVKGVNVYRKVLTDSEVAASSTNLQSQVGR